MTPWLVIGGMGVITFATRLSLILLAGRVTLPAIVWRAMRFVAPAVLAALVVSPILQPAGALDLSAGNERLLAATLAGLVAWRANNALLTIGLGMAALWILQWVRP